MDLSRKSALRVLRAEFFDAHKKTLIDSNEAHNLSARLYPLGEQLDDIFADLDHAGYGAPARVVQKALLAPADTEERQRELKLYWPEYAKERLAGLVGPMDILKGKIPSTAAYRSTVLAELRTRALQIWSDSESAPVSPQIEPTIKQYVEMMPDDPIALQINENVKAARKKSCTRIGPDRIV
jgi:hypothetical protein